MSVHHLLLHGHHLQDAFLTVKVHLLQVLSRRIAKDGLLRRDSLGLSNRFDAVDSGSAEGLLQAELHQLSRPIDVGLMRNKAGREHQTPADLVVVHHLVNHAKVVRLLLQRQLLRRRERTLIAFLRTRDRSSLSVS